MQLAADSQVNAPLDGVMLWTLDGEQLVAQRVALDGEQLVAVDPLDARA